MQAFCDEIVEILPKMIARIAKIPLNGQQLLIEYMTNIPLNFQSAKEEANVMKTRTPRPRFSDHKKKTNYDALANESSLQFVSEINTMTNS